MRKHRKEIALSDIRLEEVAVPLEGRRHGDDLDLLAESIRDVGCIEPPIVARNPPDSRQKYRVLSGLRRVLAARRAGLERIVCEVRRADTSEIDAFILRLVSNVARAQLTPLQEAKSFAYLVREGFTVADIARKCAVSSNLVSKRLKLLALCPEARDALENADLSLAECETLVKLRRSDQPAAVERIRAEHVAAVPGSAAQIDTSAPLADDERELASLVLRVDPLEIVGQLLGFVVGRPIRTQGELGPALVRWLKINPSIANALRRSLQKVA